MSSGASDGRFPSCPGLSGLGSSEEFCSGFCRVTLDWDLSDVLLVVGRGPGFGEERAVLPHHLVKGTSVSTTSLLMLTLMAWLGRGRHFSVKLPLSVPCLHRSLCHTRSPHKEGALHSPVRADSLCKLSVILPARLIRLRSQVFPYSALYYIPVNTRRFTSYFWSQSSITLSSC